MHGHRERQLRDPTRPGDGASRQGDAKRVVGRITAGYGTAAAMQPKREAGSRYARFVQTHRAWCGRQSNKEKGAQETTMLSPHEIAALVLVCEESKPRDLDMADIEALLAHQLITLEPMDSGLSEPRVTVQGHALLKSLGVIRTPTRRGTLSALR
jgi:hypothetical protein